MRLRLFTSVLVSLLASCSVLAVADAGVSVVATTVKAGVNVVGAAVDAVLSSKEKQ